MFSALHYTRIAFIWCEHRKLSTSRVQSSCEILGAKVETTSCVNTVCILGRNMLDACHTYSHYYKLFCKIIHDTLIRRFIEIIK